MKIVSFRMTAQRYTETPKQKKKELKEDKLDIK